MFQLNMIQHNFPDQTGELCLVNQTHYEAAVVCKEVVVVVLIKG